MEGSNILLSARADPETSWNKAGAITGNIMLFMVEPSFVRFSIASIRMSRHRDIDMFTALVAGYGRWGDDSAWSFMEMRANQIGQGLPVRQKLVRSGFENRQEWTTGPRMGVLSRHEPL
jgi:hypothetical protein